MKLVKINTDKGRTYVDLEKIEALQVNEVGYSSITFSSGRDIYLLREGARQVEEALHEAGLVDPAEVVPPKAPLSQGDLPAVAVKNEWGKVWRHELESWGYIQEAPEPSGHVVKESQPLPSSGDVKLALGHTPTEEGTKIGFFGQTLPAEGHRAYDPKAITAESWNRLVKETEKALGARDLAAINRRAAENLAAAVREKWKERAEVAKRTAEVWTGSWHEEGGNPSMVRLGPEKSKDEKVTEAIGARINDNWGKEWKDHSILRAQAEKTLEPFAGTSRICACETCDSLKTCQTYLATNGDATSKVALCKDCAEAWGTKGPGG